jgi:hypothetical protein
MRRPSALMIDGVIGLRPLRMLLSRSVTLNDSGRRGIRDLPQKICIPDNILTNFAARDIVALMEACDIEIDDCRFSPDSERITASH